MRGFWRSLVSDTQLRWLGPEKGVIHLATAAVVNAVWDLWAKREGKPLWKLLVRSLARGARRAASTSATSTDALAPEEALDLLRDARRGRGRSARREIVASGYPAYTTSAGWLGYDDDKVEPLVREALASGFTPREDEGRRRPRVRRPPRRPDPPRARPRRRPDDGREPGLGRRRGDRVDARARARTIRGGSRSRRAPTTCSATPASAARSRRSASRRASTSRTA